MRPAATNQRTQRPGRALRDRSRLGAVGVAALLALAVVLSPAGPVQAGGRSTTPSKVNPGKTTRPVLGNPKARVKIVVFGSMQCPYTKMLMSKALPRLVKAYPKKVQVVWRDNPLAFHKGGQLAAQAGREVFLQRGSKAFFAFQRLVFANIRSITRVSLMAWAKKVGANGSKVGAALSARTHLKWVQADQKALGARNARGTPFSFVAGQPVRGTRPFSYFKRIVDTL